MSDNIQGFIDNIRVSRQVAIDEYNIYSHRTGKFIILEFDQFKIELLRAELELTSSASNIEILSLYAKRQDNF